MKWLVKVSVLGLHEEEETQVGRGGWRHACAWGMGGAAHAYNKVQESSKEACLRTWCLPRGCWRIRFTYSRYTNLTHMRTNAFILP